MIINIVSSAILCTSLLFMQPSTASADYHPPQLPANGTPLQQAGSELLSLLRNRDFMALDSRLNALQSDYESNTSREDDLATAFNWIAIPNPDLEDLFLQWQKSYPESYAANLALGSYYRAMANQWRGSKYSDDTHAYRITMMNEYLEKAVAQLVKSLRMAKKPTFSYTKLISIATNQGNRDAASQWLADALKCDPYCVRPRTAYMRSLEPRWGGSYMAMKAFADAAGKVNHPKLEKAARMYEGWAYWYSGYQKYLAKDYVGALNEYNKALLLDENSSARLDRARIYRAVGQVDLALADLSKSLELNPQSTEAHYIRAESLLDKRQTEEALQEMRFAAEFADMSAMNKLGALYFFGNAGVPVNLQEGLQLWQRAAYFWDEYASYNLGAAYERGLGVREDKATAVNYYRIAADQGYEPAINDLGLMLWYGRGTNVNKDEAIALWVAGARKGVWQSKHNLEFFLSLAERFKLVFRYPDIFLKDKTIIFAAVIVLFIFVAVVVVAAVRILKNKTTHQC
jgi:TPR repeat protein